MVVAYVDLRGLSLHRFGALDPFIGFGVGTARIHIGETRMTFQNDGRCAGCERDRIRLDADGGGCNAAERG